MSVVSDRKQNATEWFEQMQRLLTRNMLSTLMDGFVTEPYLWHF